MPTTLVRQWMSSPAIAAPPDLSLPDALHLMATHRIRRLPVCENGKLVGIVTRGDLRGAQPSQATSLSIFELHYLVGRIMLEQIMTRHVIVVTPNTPVQEAANIMLEHKISGLPVVDQGKVVGIITESDIFRMVIATRPEPIRAAQPA